MPIINEMKSLDRLEAVGFTHDQAKAIIEVTGEGHQDGFSKYTDVLHWELRQFTAELRLEIRTIRTDVLKAQRDQILPFVVLVSLALAVISGLIGAALKWL